MSSQDFIDAVCSGYLSLLESAFPIVLFIGGCNIGINILLGAFMRGSLKIGGGRRA